MKIEHVLSYLLVAVLPLIRVAGAEPSQECGETAPNEMAAASPWRYDVEGSGWFPTALYLRANTDIASYSQHFGATQLRKMYRAGGVVRFSATKDPWGIFADFSYGDLRHASEDSHGPSFLGLNYPVEDGIRCAVLQCGGSYRFGGDTISCTLRAGAQYLGTDTHFVLDDVNVDSNKHSVEPMAGGRLDVRLLNRWTLSAGTNVSGFGMGTVFSMDSEARISYQMSEKVKGFAGYRIFDVAYQQPAGRLVNVGFHNFRIPVSLYGDMDLEIEATIQGPVAGLEIRW